MIYNCALSVITHPTRGHKPFLTVKYAQRMILLDWATVPPPSLLVYGSDTIEVKCLICFECFPF